jgi:hypothetical protein
MREHTPGPWKIERQPRKLSDEGRATMPMHTPPPCVNIVTDYDHPQLDGPASVVGIAFGPYADPNARVVIRDEDAALIAAAPELLAALSGMVSLIDRVGLDRMEKHVPRGQKSWFTDAVRACLDAREAIAKATTPTPGPRAGTDNPNTKP